MGKKAAKKAPQRSQSATATTTATGGIPVVGAREDCPCGSGLRYKACHGREASHAVQELVHRPFEGLSGEADWVALRELVAGRHGAADAGGRMWRTRPPVTSRR